MSEAAAALTGDNGSAGNGAAGSTGDAGAQAPAWNAGFDEDTNAFVENKGWGGVDDVLSSYRNLEKFAGGAKNLVELPGVDADADAMNAFYGALGRPDTPDDYGFEMPDGGDSELFGWFRGAAHKHGLTESQAASFLNDYQEMVGGRQEAFNQQTQADGEKAISDLKKEWGQAYDSQVDAGKRAVAELGYDEQALNGLEDKMGTAEMLKLFATLGSKMGEDSFEDGKRGDGASFGLTPAAAQQQISDLKMDKSFMDHYLGGNPEAVAKMKRLMEAANG